MGLKKNSSEIKSPGNARKKSSSIVCKTKRQRQSRLERQVDQINQAKYCQPMMVVFIAKYSKILLHLIQMTWKMLQNCEHLCINNNISIPYHWKLQS